jgi:hypothetical protein
MCYCLFILQQLLKAEMWLHPFLRVRNREPDEHQGTTLFYPESMSDRLLICFVTDRTSTVFPNVVDLFLSMFMLGNQERSNTVPDCFTVCIDFCPTLCSCYDRLWANFLPRRSRSSPTRSNCNAACAPTRILTHAHTLALAACARNRSCLICVCANTHTSIGRMSAFAHTYALATCAPAHPH